MNVVNYAFAFVAAGLAFSANAADSALISKGEYLTRAADCVACHVVPGGKPFAGGLGFKLPFGTLYSPNITPDKETGIGNWTDDEFVSALQQGVGKDGEHYYPAFPYTSYTLMPREDILAIKAYLFSLAPVHQPTQENDLSFPFNQRWGMFFWNMVFNANERFTPDAKQSAEWNRGAYLVQGPGHCGECHSPRNLFQAVSSSHSLAGNLLGNWQAYNISSDVKRGIGAWPNEALISYMAQGYAPGYGGAGGPMADVVEHSLQYLSPADLKAIAVYLKSTTARAEGVARPAIAIKAASMDSSHGLGQKIFSDACSACHRLDGTGNQTPVATLSGLKTVNDPAGTNLVATLLSGHNPTKSSVDQKMPDFARAYSDVELAAVSTYVLRRFGQNDAQIKPADVAKSRESALH
ncbi:cytochrome c [Pseudomonas sp. CCC3.2]|uniref:cytochrome c n=1 Tax=unclassified Pseudomonas TaxID=196821 RepID=UPI002AB4E9FE|nr:MULTISPECIES: cytochrome c [unclassified Pseudomonas]MDY7561218.1 cytochrome c [Pseudomonas sp. AB6]MEA9976960.1 cytochrome c [Pseudomonas sp. RTS4]MEB0180139.1 cytochrome c [Pseudomonas sp. CCC3.2]MEB0198394.1 cytochrome c [Pseudomonas sp. 5S4]MEB0211101.1 cytochrome c [Pseudomonas sp. AB6]